MLRTGWILSVFMVFISSCGEIDDQKNFADVLSAKDGADELSTEKFLEDLARKYAPELREHKDETFPFSNPEAFLKYVGLKSAFGKSTKVLIEPGKVTMEKLKKLTVNVDGVEEPVLKTSPEQKSLKHLYFYIPKENYSKVQKNKDKAPPVCYAYPHYIQGGDKIDISYSFWYPYNGTAGSNVFGLTTLLGSLGVGHHEGDWEHITVRLDKSGKKILGIHYAAHGKTEGTWYTDKNTDLKSKKGFKIKDKSQPVAWSTRDTHGSHNRAGTIKREPPSAFKTIIKNFGLLVEETSDKGRKIDCKKSLEIFSPFDPGKKNPWLLFRGRWGAPRPPDASKGGSGPTGPMFKNWWDEEPGGP